MSLFLFSIRSSLFLAEKIASLSNEALGEICFNEFKDGEYEPYFTKSIRGANIFLIGSTYPPADNLIELLLICDAAYRSSVQGISLVMPYFGWGRQDKKEKSRVSLGAKLITTLIMAAKATRVVVMDLHSNQIQGFFEIPIDQIYASKIFTKYLQFIKVNNLTIASTDLGGAKRAKNYANCLGTNVIICYKERKKANEVENITCLGEVKNRNVLFIDDIVDTAETLVIAANFIKKKGARSVSALATHSILSEGAHEKIESSFLNYLLISDTIPFKKKLSSKIKILSCATILANVIFLLSKKESIIKYILI